MDEQLELLLCYYTINKLLYGSRDFRFCCGKPGVKSMRKPGLTESGVCREYTHQLTGATHCKGASVFAVKVSSSGSVSSRVPPKWSDREVSLTFLICECLLKRLTIES